jgi:transforming growth factor-beta-induced protein
MKRLFLKLAAAATIAAVVSACGGGHDDPPGSIVDVATEARLTALLAAATKAGLADELSSSSARLTVFAPTDAAFNTLATRLGFADAGAMVSALPADALASILTFHVLPTRLNAAELASGAAKQPTLYSFEGTATTLAIDASAGVKLTDAVLTQATVTQPNVAASNGVVHVIDKVLVPPGVLNVVQMAQANPDAFSSLVGAVSQANLAGALSDANARLTVFAPTNAAFAAAPSGLSVPQLTTVLQYHVLGSQVLSSAIPFGQAINTLAGQTITISAGAPPVIATIADTTAAAGTIAAVDVRASNGVIHVIDKVLIPSLGL